MNTEEKPSVRYIDVVVDIEARSSGGTIAVAVWKQKFKIENGQLVPVGSRYGDTVTIAQFQAADL